MRTFKIVIQFDGSRYKGWQKQKDNELTIQGKIEDVLSKMAEEKVEVIGCERTDVGVHAENYVASFKTSCALSEEIILNYLYEFLPEDIVVKSIEEMEERFHARYNVKAKTYCYTITNTPFRNVFNRKYTYHLEEELSLDEMRKAADLLIGTHDFQSFTSLKSDGKSTIRTIDEIIITNECQKVKIEIKANDFLWHMPRLIIGCLIEVGMKRITIKDVERILEEKKKQEKATLAKSKGLCLKEAIY